MSILQILEEIGSNSKRSHKLTLLEQHKDNEVFMKVIKLALDPYINFYIKKLPSYSRSAAEPKDLVWAFENLEKLTQRDITGNAAIAHLASILSQLSEDDSTVVSRIIGKDLRCGVADGIVNAVVEDFIPTYPCLLARPYDEKNIKNIVYPALSQLKADGLRVNFHSNGKITTICGRSGRDIDLLGLMDDDINKLALQFNEPVVFDGELVVVDSNNKLLSRKIGNGIINKAIKGTISPEEAAMVRAQLWDVIPASEFKSGVSKLRYEARFNQLQAAIDNLLPDNEEKLVNTLKQHPVKYWVIPTRVVKSLDDAIAHFQELLAAGEEGTILKNFSGLWEDSRSKDLVKFKAEKECDLEVIGFNPGEGKFIGQVGSVICASSDRKVEVSISGFSDDLRKEITDNFETEWLKSIVTVKYNERIGSKDKKRAGVDSLFLPRFEEKRSDKTVADSSESIK